MEKSEPDLVQNFCIVIYLDLSDPSLGSQQKELYLTFEKLIKMVFPLPEAVSLSS